MDIEGWSFKRTSDGRIVIRQDDGSGVVVADGDNESIAAAILYRLASDLLDRVAQWQPIETAPKDQPILGYSDGDIIVIRFLTSSSE